MAEVSVFGAAKYEWDNWRGLEGGVQRYTDAAARHLLAVSEGPRSVDPESGLPHLAHAAWCLLAVLELSRE